MTYIAIKVLKLHEKLSVKILTPGYYKFAMAMELYGTYVTTLI